MNNFITIPTDISFGALIQSLTAQLPQVLLFSRQVTALAADSSLLNFVATFFLLAAYAELTTSAPNPTRWVIPARDISTTRMPQQTRSNCPQQVPNCSNYGGNSEPQSNPVNTNGICVGIETVKYPRSAAGCPCIDLNDPPVYQPYNNTEAITEVQAYWLVMAAYLVKFTQGTGGAHSTSGSTPTARIHISNCPERSARGDAITGDNHLPSRLLL
ncbi:MAG: hypothetical protein Q9161_000997 [Pseudevernia consocians]